MSVTHSVDEAKVLVDKIALIGPQPRRIVEEIGVNLDRPRWAYDARAEKHYVGLRSYLTCCKQGPGQWPPAGYFHSLSR